MLGAGVDTDCGGGATPRWGNNTLLRLLTNTSTAHTITPLVDASLRRLFAVRMRLGHFDPPSATPWGSFGLEQVDTPAHRALAMDAALQSFVLLMNRPEAHALPLRSSAKLAVLGPNIASASWQLGNYHERVTPPGVLQSPCQGFQALASAPDRVTCVQPPGCTVAGNVSCWDAAKSAAAVGQADAVVLFVGLDSSQEAEGHDRTTLLLPGTQKAMVDEATRAAAGKTPVVVVVMGGSAVDLSEIKSNPAISAIVWVGYPGQAGSAAIASALFGRTNRWGKSPFTWYNEGFCRAAQMSDYRMRPEGAYPGRTHRFYTGTPVFPFGSGLSLTTFRRRLTWSVPMEGRVILRGRQDSVAITVDVHIRNAGDRSGDEVVLLFVLPPPEAVARGAPRQQLAAIARLTLTAGQTAAVQLQVQEKHLLGATAGEIWRLRVNEDEGGALPFKL